VSSSEHALVGAEVLDLKDPEFRRDPYPHYARLRAEHPVVRTEGGYWLVSRYADCGAILKDQALFSSDARNARTSEVFIEQSGVLGTSVEVRPQLFYDFPRVGEQGEEIEEGRPFLFLDPPNHQRIRRLVTHAFTRTALESWRPRVRALADELLQSAVERGQIELVRDLAYPLPVTVICELLGVPIADLALFRKWSGPLAALIEPGFLLGKEERERSREAAPILGNYLLELTSERRANPSEDLLSALIAAEEEGSQLTEAEIVFNCLFLLVAGHETTVNLIGNGTLALLRNPDQRALLQKEPNLARRAVDELLRFDPPVQIVARTPLEEVEIAGQPIPAGEQVVLLLGAANRDPAVFEDPDTLNLRRDNASQHMAFGSGIHHCLGAVLARLEGEEAIRAVFDRLPELELAGQPRYRNDSVLRGLEALPVSSGRTEPSAEPGPGR
jgi:cytochrome P450